MNRWMAHTTMYTASHPKAPEMRMGHMCIICCKNMDFAQAPWLVLHNADLSHGASWLPQTGHPVTLGVKGKGLVGRLR